jgi:4-hydroxy-tetrahydrodipicolinate reductase
MENLLTGIIGGSGRLGSLVSTLCNCQKIDLNSSLDAIDICLDVSKADVIQEFLPLLLQAKKPLVVGSTGHSKRTIDLLEQASSTIAVLIAPNFSKGVYLLKTALVALKAAPTCIVETHHVHKTDKPSGTAKMIQALYKTPVPVESIRKGEEIGTHTVIFKLPFETLQITHQAESLELFAQGAKEALFFLSKKEKGLYTMDDVYKKDDYGCKI